MIGIGILEVMPKVNASETDTDANLYTEQLTQPRTAYDWDTNPKNVSSAVITLQPNVRTKLTGPWYGGFQNNSNTRWTFEWDGSAGDSRLLVEICDGNTGTTLASYVCQGSAGAVALFPHTNAPGLNFYVTNIGYRAQSYWSFHIYHEW